MNLYPGQRNALAITIFVIVVPIQLLMLAGMAYSIAAHEPDWLQTSVSYLFTIGIFSFPLWWAWRTWKSASPISAPISESIETTTPATSTISVLKVQTKVELSEYRRLLFYLTYSTPVFIFALFLTVSLLLFYLTTGNGSWIVFFLLIFNALVPISIYRNANANYRSTKALHEPVTYDFSDESFTASGPSFNTTMQWRSLYQVKELKNWFLLYTSKQVLMMIPKRAFGTIEQLDAFRAISLRRQ